MALTREEILAFDRPRAEATAANLLRKAADAADGGPGEQIAALADCLAAHAAAGGMTVGVTASEPMEADFFGALYVELERAGDQGGWLGRQGISRQAWLSFVGVLHRELNDAVRQGLDPGEAIDATVAAAMQVGWEAARRTPPPAVPRPA